MSARRIIILGGGFLGQLLQSLLPDAEIFDWRPKAPEQQNRALGPQYLWKPLPHIPCDEILVNTFVDGEEPTPERIRAYKKKVGKEQDNSDWLAQFQPQMTGYLPHMPEARITYNRRVEFIDLDGHRLVLRQQTLPYTFVLNTVPLYALLQMCPLLTSLLHKGVTALDHRPIYMQSETMLLTHPPHVMSVNYVSDPENPIYRSTYRENQRYHESLHPLPHAFKMEPGKIYASKYAEDLNRMLALYGVFNFGRYAAWRPEELAHQTFTYMQQWCEEHK